MAKNIIQEDATETAKKVRKELKKAFSTVKFSVKTSKYAGGSSMTVSWIDGPMKDEVENITNQFEGADFDGMTDMKNYKSYEYEGNFYNGVDFIFTSREISAEHKAKIVAHAKTLYEDLNINDHSYNIKIIEAEKDLLLFESDPEAYAEKARAENQFNEENVHSKVRQATVINFEAKKQERKLFSMTPEQKLKLMTLEIVFKGKEDLLKKLFDEGITVDSLFSAMAQDMFENEEISKGYIEHFVKR